MNKKILMTGAAGNVASQLRPLLRARYGEIVLSDIADVDDLQEGENFVAADLTDKQSIKDACTGVSAILHFGGQPGEAAWDVINERNIQGAVNLFEAAREQGVERVVFASSNHAIGMYPRSRRIGTEVRTRPDSYYGLSKVFGEALGALYADKFGMRALSVRIGNVDKVPVDLRRLSLWIHPEDLLQLCAIGIEHPTLHHAVVYGASDNARTYWDNGAAFSLGYRPRHKAEDHVEGALSAEAANDPDPVGDLLQGGGFCSAGFDGDLDRTLWSE